MYDVFFSLCDVFTYLIGCRHRQVLQMIFVVLVPFISFKLYVMKKYFIEENNK